MGGTDHRGQVISFSAPDNSLERFQFDLHQQKAVNGSGGRHALLCQPCGQTAPECMSCKADVPLVARRFPAGIHIGRGLPGIDRHNRQQVERDRNVSFPFVKGSEASWSISRIMRGDRILVCAGVG